MSKIFYLFGQLDDGDIAWFARAGDLRALGEGEVLITQGQPLDAMFIVLEGQFSIAVAHLGRVATVGRGEILGEISFVDSRPPVATVIAVSHAVVLAIPRVPLGKRLAADAPFAARFYRALALFLSDRLRAAEAPRDADTNHPSRQLDPLVLEDVTNAGLRFDRLVRTLARGDGALR